MTIDDLKFEPMSDMGVNDENVVKEHDELIESGNYTEATKYLNNKNYKKGARASFFNGLTGRTSTLGDQLINNPARVDEVYSNSEPVNSTDTWWFQPSIEIYYYKSSSNSEGLYTNCELIEENNVNLGTLVNGFSASNGKYANSAKTKKLQDVTSYIEIKIDLSNIRKLELDAMINEDNTFEIIINNMNVFNYKHQTSTGYSETIVNIGNYNFTGECTVRIGGSSVSYGLGILGIIGLNM